MKKIFVGIDVSKSWIDVCVTIDGKCILHHQFVNNIMGFKAMIKWIKEFSKAIERMVNLHGTYRYLCFTVMEFSL